MFAGLFGITLDTARDAALIVAATALGLALVSAWLVKAIVSKVLTVAVLAVLAVVVWTQRTSLDDCADRVRDTLSAGAVDDTTCTFFGRDVTVSAPRGG